MDASLNKIIKKLKGISFVVIICMILILLELVM